MVTGFCRQHESTARFFLSSRYKHRARKRIQIQQADSSASISCMCKALLVLVNNPPVGVLSRSAHGLFAMESQAENFFTPAELHSPFPNLKPSPSHSKLKLLFLSLKVVSYHTAMSTWSTTEQYNQPQTPRYVASKVNQLSKKRVEAS